MAGGLAAAPDFTVALVDGAVEISELGGSLDASWEDRVRVTVYDEADPEAERPPVLGTFQRSGDVLRFQPMFPFEPGMSYRVTVEVEGATPGVSLLHVPARDVSPTTVVTHVYPTSDVLPENQLKLYVHFSAPMAGGDGLEHVKLVDEDGKEVIDPFLPLGEHFWDRDGRRYTIFFDPGRVKQGILPNEQMGRPLTDGKRYRLVIDADWRDDEGLPLASGYEKAFEAGPADVVPLDTADWRLSEPKAHTREPLVVTFPEPLDHEILARALSVRRENVIPGEVVVLDGETRWSFTPESPWLPGDYVLVALGELEDLAGNRIGQPFEVDVFERIDRPDEQESYEIPFSIVPSR